MPHRTSKSITQFAQMQMAGRKVSRTFRLVVSTLLILEGSRDIVVTTRIGASDVITWIVDFAPLSEVGTVSVAAASVVVLATHSNPG